MLVFVSTLFLKMEARTYHCASTDKKTKIYPQIAYFLYNQHINRSSDCIYTILKIYTNVHIFLNYCTYAEDVCVNGEFLKSVENPET